MNLAIRDIGRSAVRFLLTAFGIGLLTSGSLVMQGIYRGIVTDATKLVRTVDADIWVVEAATTGPFAETSRVPRSLVDRVAAVPGVRAARAFALASETVTADGRRQTASLLSLDLTDDGGWLPLMSGRLLRSAGEIVVDASLGVAIGGAVTVGGETLTVVGLMEGMVEPSGDPMVAVAAADFRRVQGYRPPEAVELARASSDVTPGDGAALSAVTASLQPGRSSFAVLDRIRTWPDVAALTRDDQLGLVINGRLERLRKQILLFTGLLSVITAAVVTVTIYAMTVEKQHTIALLKLMGARDRVVLRLILDQTGLLAVSGIALGFWIEATVAPLFPRRIVVDSGAALQVSAIVVVTCLIGSIAGIWRASRIDAREALS
ncbi:ABC transporter permease [Pleomorphomonas sp. JP5]|uniref:ABC transporter permease n=1 Tax=Pleomorphomonas sp. JP5 TaxID=2942998 RepID=UPI002043A439|nr:ABC transporter permease [Pleomorphomonas sp. JP5]MCM5557686.1 ABC transporter permease [Pleomorphomonas sp. JP5]